MCEFGDKMLKKLELGMHLTQEEIQKCVEFARAASPVMDNMPVKGDGFIDETKPYVSLGWIVRTWVDSLDDFPYAEFVSST